MKKQLFLILAISLFSLSRAQTQPTQTPQTQTSPTIGLQGLFGPSNAQQNQQLQIPSVIPTLNQDSVKPKSEEPAKDVDKLKRSNDLELDNKLMQLKKEQLLLQQELSDLQRSGDTTRQDSINLAIKKKNLELLFLKEQVLLRKELEKYGIDSKVLPAPAVVGQVYFRNPRLRMLNAPNDVAPNESYVLGSGDQIQIDIWGRAGYSGNYTVDESGFVTIPRMQRVYVKDKTLGEVRSLLRTRFRQIISLSGSSMSISVSDTRSITVHVAGEVFYPGTYALSAHNSAFNILTLAGGPKNEGSLRSVMIQRGGVIIDTFDLYKYIFGGQKNQEKFLQNNDRLIVPLAHKKVTIQGPLKRVGTFELKQGENLFDLLEYTGGFRSQAYLKDVVLKRFVANSHAEILTINIDSFMKVKKDFVLQDGDNIGVKGIVDIFEGLINLSKGVNIPGTYKLEDGDRVSDLLERAGGLNRDAYLQNAYVLRTNDDLSEDVLPFSPADILTNKSSAFNYKLQFRDKLLLFERNQFIDRFRVSSSGSFRFPSSLPYKKGLTANILVRYSGGINREAYTGRAYIIRNIDNFKKEIIPLILDSSGFLTKDIELMPSDQLVVYPKLNRWKEYSISVKGEVIRPGNVSYSIGLTLYDLLLMTGGLTKTAENKQVEIVRTFEFENGTRTLKALSKSSIQKLSISKDFESNRFLDTFLLYPFDEVYIRNQYVDFPGHVQLVGEVKYPGTYAIMSSDETLRDIVARAGGFTKFASKDGIRLMRNYDSIDVPVRLIVNWKKVENRQNSRFNYSVIENDKLIIPKKDKTVVITGELNELSKNGTVATYYVPGRRAKFYIREFAGGFSKETSKKGIVVEHPDGRVKKTRNYVIFKVYPKVSKGATITIPTKDRKARRKINLDATLTKVLTTTTSVLTLLALINIATGR